MKRERYNGTKATSHSRRPVPDTHSIPYGSIYVLQFIESSGCESYLYQKSFEVSLENGTSSTLVASLDVEGESVLEKRRCTILRSVGRCAGHRQMPKRTKDALGIPCEIACNISASHFLKSSKGSCLIGTATSKERIVVVSI